MALDLDARQRAMLEEMHVRVWWPQAQATAPAQLLASPAQSAGAPAAAPAPAPLGALAAAPISQPPVARPVPAVVPPAGVAAAPRPAVAPADAGRAAAIAALDWTALQRTVAGCDACNLCGTRKNTVFGVGPAAPTAESPPRGDWLIVGEAPGEQEDLRGEPFVGQAGKLLDNMLRAVGASRHGDAKGAQAAFIVNVLKCRPPGNRNPALDEIAQCEPFLKRQIALLQPRIILAVGRFAAQAVLAGSVPDVQTLPLGRLRGKVYRYEGVPVVVSYHPAYLLRSLPEKAKAWADLCLAMETVTAP